MRYFLLAVSLGLLPTLFGCGSEKRAALDKEEQKVVLIGIQVGETRVARGTGFLVSPRGLLVTADHVVREQEGSLRGSLIAIRVMGKKTAEYQLEFVKSLRESNRPARDIAIMRLRPAPENLPHFQVGEEARAGDPVRIVGFPQVFERSVATAPLFRFGWISSTSYDLDKEEALVLDMPGVQGYSGAPVINARTDRVVGVWKGSPRDKETAFSMALRLFPADLDGCPP